MSKPTVPDVAGLFMELTMNQDLPVIEMRIERDLLQQPVEAKLVFGEAVKDIPKGLPKSLISGEREIPIVYHTFDKR